MIEQGWNILERRSELSIEYNRRIISQSEYIKEIYDKISIFSNGVSGEDIKEFIVTLSHVNALPNNPTVWDTIRSGFELVAQSNDVERELKVKLRNKLLGMGVSRLKEI
jgi:hypothetical protein